MSYFTHPGITIGPIFGVAGGLLLEAAPHIGTDWQGITGLVIGVGGVLTGVGGIVQRAVETRSKIRSLQEQVDGLRSQNAGQAVEMLSLFQCQTDLRAHQAKMALRNRADAAEPQRGPH